LRAETNGSNNRPVGDQTEGRGTDGGYRTSEVRVIEQIVGVAADLEIEAFVDLDVPHDREIKIREPRSNDGVASQVSEAQRRSGGSSLVHEHIWILNIPDRGRAAGGMIHTRGLVVDVHDRVGYDSADSVSDGAANAAGRLGEQVRRKEGKKWWMLFEIVDADLTWNSLHTRTATRAILFPRNSASTAWVLAVRRSPFASNS
jgi:hypothetical protein